MSGTNSNGYIVSRATSCCKECQSGSSQFVCTQEECKFLCVHMYTCDPLCFDFNNGHLCKHIHRVHSHDQPASVFTEEVSGDMEVSDMDYLSYAEACKPPSQGTCIYVAYLGVYTIFVVMQIQQLN